MRSFNFISFFLMAFTLILFSNGINAQNILVTGRMTDSGGEGINIFHFNSSNANISLFSKADAGPNPSFLCFSKRGNLIYAANEVSNFKGERGGGVTTLEYSEDFSRISKVKEISVPNGSPCYISISPDNKFLFVANYTGGSVTVFKLDNNGIPEKISDSINFKSNSGKISHAHMISYDPAGKNIYLTDFGLDRIMIYKLDEITGKLISLNENGIALPSGTGPRHFVFNTDGSKMYVIGESKSTVTVFKVDEKSGLSLLQTVTTLSETYKGTSYGADIHLGNSGEFLYGSNRGENSIVTFRVGSNGLLTVAGHTSCGGDWPRNFAIDPSGKYLLVGNQRSGNISILDIDNKSGLPSNTSGKVDLNSPVCLKFH